MVVVPPQPYRPCAGAVPPAYEIRTIIAFGESELLLELSLRLHLLFDGRGTSSEVQEAWCRLPLASMVPLCHTLGLLPIRSGFHVGGKQS